MADRIFEIPQSMRAMAQKNVEQAKDAYDRFMETSRRAQETMTASSETMAASGKQIQQTMLRFTEENVQSAFELAEKIAKAKDLREAFEVQNSHARRQMEAYSRQAQELARLMGDTAKKSPGR